MEAIFRDFRHAFRKLILTPGLSAVTVLALALGLGLTTMMFSIVYGAFWRGLPFEESERIMHLERNNLAAGINSMEVPIHDFVEWRAEQESFEDLAAFYSGTVNVSGEERAERYDGSFITPEAFRLLRVTPELGRTFLADERGPSANPVILLGHHVWQERYDGDPDIVGRTLRVNGKTATVVGVMPEGFRFPVTQDVWVPLPLDPLETPRGEGQTLEVIGRLKPGVTLDQAAAEMVGIAKRIELEYPETNEGISAVVKPYVDEFMGGEEENAVNTMLGAAFFVLLIACANVASLLLARALQRTREIGVRTAMGARRWRLVWQFLLEAFAVATVGAVIGVGIAWLGVGWFNRAIADTGAPFWIDIRIDGASLLFALVAVVIATIAAGGLPAWQAARADVAEILKDESRGSSGFRIGRLSRGLVVFEVALSCALLVAAGVTVRSVVRLNTVEYPYPTEDVLTARLGLMEGDYPEDEDLHRFYEDLEQRLAAIPSVSSASVSGQLPGFWGGFAPFGVEGSTYEEDQDYPFAHRIPASPGFFRTYEAEPMAGRGIEEGDRASSLPIAVVNESFARRYFEGDALGRRVRFGRSDTELPWRTVVGVVPDLHAGGIRADNPEAIYIPAAQADYRFISLSARTRGDATAITADVREAVRAIDPDIPLYWVGSLSERIGRQNWHIGLFGSIFGTLGLVALFLSAVGLYAVMAFAVGQRTREIGVRMALGARGRDVLSLVVRQGLVQIAVGVVLGLAMAAGLVQLLTDLLFDVNPRDPMSFSLTILILVTTGAAASLLPARRATRVDPVEALRSE
jgi:putative ABC transport system permease protein